MPVGGNFTSCNCGSNTACANPTEPLATVGLCLPDGTPIAVAVTRDCAGNVLAEGWIDLTTGLYTAGPALEGTASCSAGCVTTVCRALCDDTDGDGQADATYSELWCIKADGSASLVLAYQDDPNVPYTPVGPVECSYGCPETETIQLCDDAGPFLRRYTWLNGVATFEDFALDGQTAYVVTGTVRTCSGETPCAEQTTPAATLGLCLADGTPIAVIVTRDCDGTVTQDGWLNLTTGAYSAGDPPAGTMACGNPRSISTTGTFCDVDAATGDVLGLVLIEYTYGADGSVAAVRLVDATTGQTYTPQGEVTTCPAGVEQPERDLTQLCDTAGDGTVTAFVRDFARDENGQITGHTDYLLDGTPYTPAGTVGRCTEPCRDSSSTLLCDAAEQEPITVFDPANVPGSDGWQVVSYTTVTGNPPEAALPYDAPHPPGAFMGARSDLSAGAGPSWPGYDAAPHRWVLRKEFTAPEDGIATVSSIGFRGDGGARVRVNGQDAGMYGQWNQPATSGTAQIPVTAGPNTVEIEVRDGAGNNWVQGRLDIVMVKTVQFMRHQTVDCETGEVVSTTDTTLDGQPYTVTGEVGQCTPTAECCEQPPPETRVDIETGELCLVDDETGEVVGRVLAERVYDDQSGDRVEQRYVDPVTGDPVTPPAGASFAVCPPEPCRDTYTAQVCDLPTGDPAGVPTATDTSAVGYPWDAAAIRCVNQHPAGGAALWAGGSVTIPARSSGAGGCSPNQWLAGLAATLQASRPSCDSGTVTITAAVAARNDGPAAAAANYAGSLRIHRTDTGERLADSGSVLSGTAAGTVRTMTATAVNVPAGLLAAGQIVVALDVETWDQTGNTGAAWLLSNFTAAYEFQQDGCETQFLRKIVTDCETGETISVTDTTLDGEPYTVTGEVGQCQTVSECCEAVPPETRIDVESDVMCIRDAAGEITGQVLVERVYDDQSGDRLEQRLTDPTSGDEVALPAGAELVLCQEPECPVAFSTECVSLVERSVASYDNTSLISGVPGKCGSVQGPSDNPNSGASFGCNAGPFTITSWIINGEEAIADGATPTFEGGPCGPGNGDVVGMHQHWADLLNNLDTTGSTWVVDAAEGCAWYIHSIGNTAGTEYGPMVVTGNGQNVENGTWVLGPVQSCTETQYTKVYSQDCDGSVSVSWLDAEGVPTDAPEGDLVPCGTGCGSGGGSGLDIETLTLCDLQADGTGVPFLRHLTYGSTGQVAIAVDTALDGFAPYTPTGTVGRCQPEGRDVEIVPMCVIDDEGGGGVLQRILAEVTYDTATGERLGVNYVDPITWGPVALPGGTRLGLCPETQPEAEPDVEVVQLCDLVDGADPVPFLRHLVYLPGVTAPTVVDTILDGVTPYTLTGTAGLCSTPCDVQQVLERCQCDDTDGDGVADTDYVELFGVDCQGAVTSIGTYVPDLSGPYTPVAPVDCDQVDEGADPAVGVQARRVELAAGASWDASSVAALQSVTAVAFGGSGTITTTDGASTLHTGEAATWSVARAEDAALTGPLIIAADSGTVTVTWTQGVTL